MLAAGAAIFNATDPWYATSGKQRAFEPREIVVVANSMDQAQLFIRQVRLLLESKSADPRIYAAVNWDACRQDLISFVDNVSIRAMPLSSRSTRGPACSLLVFDESGHFQAGGEGVGEGNEVYQALAPTVAQYGDQGHILFTSTPKLRMGLFWDMYRAGTAKPSEPNYDPTMYVIQRATWEISPNPNLTRERLEKQFPGRPEWVATEYGADFASAAGSFINPEDVYACQREDGTTLPPVDGVQYRCTIDPAFQRDNFAMAIAHKERDFIVVDGVWAWNKKGYSDVLDEIAAIVKPYRIRSIRTDQFAGAPILDGLQQRGLETEVKAWTNPQSGSRDAKSTSENKYDAYSRLKARLITRRISLPRDPALASELVNLTQVTTVTQVVRIEAAGGGHDDRASVLAALMGMLDGNSAVFVMTANFDPDRGDVSDGADPFAEYDNLED